MNKKINRRAGRKSNGDPKVKDVWNEGSRDSPTRGGRDPTGSRCWGWIASLPEPALTCQIRLLDEFSVAGEIVTLPGMQFFPRVLFPEDTIGITRCLVGLVCRSECVPVICRCCFADCCCQKRLTLPRASSLRTSLVSKTTMSWLSRTPNQVGASVS